MEGCMDYNTQNISYCVTKNFKNWYSTVMKRLNNTFAFGDNAVARERLHILEHYYQFGWKSTTNAFKIGKSTLYEWKTKYEKSDKKLSSLIPVSTKPKRFRQSNVDWRLIEFIKVLRQKRYKISKHKIKSFLDEYSRSIGVNSISVSTIGRIIKRKHLYYDIRPKRIKQRCSKIKNRIRRAPKVKKPGYLQMDSIIVYLDGKKYYFMSCIDVCTKLAIVRKVPTLSSKQAKLTLISYQNKHQYHKPRVVQTDNGSEFLKYFHDYLNKEKIKHQFIYPRCPRINGVVERFNRTFQEECLQQSEAFLFNIEEEISEDVNEYLKWYNYRRPHASLKYKSPVDFLFTSFPECIEP